uniref:Uncharacterized protein n=1 Tax=viral metagenome TaxID=1070528 RepID=A0A6H2A5J3_9ZZZZ
MRSNPQKEIGLLENHSKMDNQLLEHMRYPYDKTPRPDGWMEKEIETNLLKALGWPGTGEELERWLEMKLAYRQRDYEKIPTKLPTYHWDME